MKLSVPTNFQDDLIPRLNKKEVSEVYGKLTADFVGGCMASYMLPSINKNKLHRHLNQAHAHGLKFNYLLNSVCLGAREWSIGGQRRLHRLLDWIADIGTDSVTVSNPYLLQLIKKEYPRLKVSVSISAQIDSIAKARHWGDLGADLINLDLSIYRNFALLAKIRKYTECKLQVLANSICLQHCPFRFYHFATSAHASQIGDKSKGSAIDYCLLSCKYLRLLDTTNFIHGGWIRPEDVHYYEDLGIESLKLEDRAAHTDDICRIVTAYTDRRYDGNLMDLILMMSERRFFKGPAKLSRGIKYFFRPFRYNPLLIYKLSKVLSRLEVSIDNRALDGFLEHFVKGNCKEGMCLDCGYCQKIAEKAVKIDKDYREKMASKYKLVLDMLLSQRMYKFI